MPDEYRKTVLNPLGYDFEESILERCDPYLTLSRNDVLAIVQSAFEVLGDNDPHLIAIKQQVLTDVAEGKLAHALRTAITGAATWAKPTATPG